MRLIGKNEKIENSLKELERGLEEFQSSDMWKNYLDTISVFHNYSPCNCLLIKLQYPSATFVAGFNVWKKLGRFVKKGEKGIAILAPVYKNFTRQVETVNGEIEEIEETVLIGFRTVYVFDITQTEGKELNLSIYHPLKGQAPEDLITSIENIIFSIGYSITYGDCGKAEGYTNSIQKLVFINNTREPLTQLATLVHELAHILLHNPTQLSRDEQEFEAESVAYVVLKSLGIEIGQSAFAYITVWHPTLKDFLERAERVRIAANNILDRI